MTNEQINSVEKQKIRLYLPHIKPESLFLGIILAIVGGFLDAYTYIGRGGIFANAQTGNLVLVAVEAVDQNYKLALIKSLPIFAFIIGVLFSETVNKNSSNFLTRHHYRTILIIEIILLFIVGFMPYGNWDMVVTTAISFVASLQYSTFKKLVDSPYASTMCTGNLRSASMALHTAFTKKDHAAGVKSLRYFTIVIFFILGAFFGGFVTSHIGAKAVWVSIILLIFCLISLHIERDDTTSKSSLSK